MKRYLFSILALVFLTGFSAQAQRIKQPLGTPSSRTQALGTLEAMNTFILPKPVVYTPDSIGAARYKPQDSTIEVWTGTQWIKPGGGTGGNAFNSNRPSTNTTIPGLNGVVLGGSTVQETLEAFLFPSQVPTAGLSLTYNGQTGTALAFERSATGSATLTVNWTAGRQASTKPLTSVTVGGVSQSFSQPAAGASTSGSYTETLTYNSAKSVTNTVIASDNKSAAAGASVSWYWKRYYGFSASATPTDATIRSLTNEAITSRTRGETAALTPTGSQYFVIAFPESFDPGTPPASQIWSGGFNSTGTFTRTVRSFTNALGATTNYIIYVSTNPTSGGVSFDIR